MICLSRVAIKFRAREHSQFARTLTGSNLAAFIAIVLVSASVACDKAPSLSYRAYVKTDPDKVPVIVVGQILGAKIGRDLSKPPYSWIRLEKVEVRVENVLRGDVHGTVVPIYYFNSNSSGPRHMGMLGRGGDWRSGDRIIWFLTWESGVLRTIKDTWADATVTILTGPHTGYKPKPNESYTHQVIDLLLDPGQRCDADQWALAILKSTTRSSGFDPDYTIAKLRTIALRPYWEASEVAMGELQVLSCAFPQHRDAAAGLCDWQVRK